MVLFLVLVALALLAGPQAVLAKSFNFKFTAQVEQCAQVSLTFKKNENADSIPTALTLLPFGGHAVRIPIPTAAVNSSGVNITFLPLPANTMFIASLDDDQGENSASPSDVMMVIPSNDTSCLPGDDTQAPFTFPQSVSQCNDFTVNYQTATAPTVRILSPNIDSLIANMTEDSPETQTATYTLKGWHGLQIILSASTSNNLADGWVSNLMAVQGHHFSPKNCFGNKNLVKGGNNNGEGQNDDDEQQPGVPRGVVIGLSVGGGVILIIGAMMTAYLIYQRRRKRLRGLEAQDRRVFVQIDAEKSTASLPVYDKQTGLMQQISQLSPQETYTSGYPGTLRYSGDGFVENPAYTREKYTPTEDGFSIIEVPRDRDTDSVGSWVKLDSKSSHGMLKHKSSTSLRKQALKAERGKRDSSESLRRNPMSYDIEQMLALAADGSTDRNPSRATNFASTLSVSGQNSSQEEMASAPIIREPQRPPSIPVALRAAAPSPPPPWWNKRASPPPERPYPSGVPQASMAMSNYTASPVTTHPDSEINPFNDGLGVPIRFSNGTPRQAMQTTVSRYSSESNVLPPLSRENTLRPPVPEIRAPRINEKKPRSRFSDPSLISNGAIGRFPAPARPPRSPQESRSSGSSWGDPNFVDRGRRLHAAPTV